MSNVKRIYRQTSRAERTAETRQRIVEAAVELHGTVGPGRTSLSDVADKAGVSRPTLYSHFSNEAQLFRACTMHWMQQDPPPDPSVWLGIEDPRDRVELALLELYSNYERNAQMTENVYRDMYRVESMREFHVPLVEGAFAAMTEILVDGFDDDLLEVMNRRRGSVGVALSFSTWKLLFDQGMTPDEASDLMTDAVVRSP